MVVAPRPGGLPRDIAVQSLRTLTVAQERAIRAAMQTFVDDDLAFDPAGRPSLRWCARCAAERQAPGCVDYDCGTFCNPCATEYELARARGAVWTPAEFLGR